MMSLTVFCAVLAAAFLHAAWNAGIKTGTSKQTSMLILTVWQGIAGVLIVVWRPFPAPEVWPWLIASGFVHMFYQLFLAYAYEQGDLSRVYPLDPVGYVGWLLLMAAFFYLPAVLALKGRDIVYAPRRDWVLGAFIGVASFVAYGIVIWAATQAPLALVAALRETSILFAMLLGWALFGDRMDRTKIIAGGLIVAGVLLTRL